MIRLNVGSQGYKPNNDPKDITPPIGGNVAQKEYYAVKQDESSVTNEEMIEYLEDYKNELSDYIDELKRINATTAAIHDAFAAVNDREKS